MFCDLLAISSNAMQWKGALKDEGVVGCWNFLWWVVLAKELAKRLEMRPDASFSGFTPEVLASLIVSDL